MGQLNLIDRFHHWRKKMRWNRQYKSGKWDYLNNEREALRYIKILEFIKLSKKDAPRILDLGAGEAVLNSRLDIIDYSYFLNVDYSKSCIDKAKAKSLVNSKSVVADIHSFNPDEEFDVIIFNEAFYYVHDNLKKEVLNRFLNKLSKNGLIICSIYREGVGCWEYFNEHTNLQRLDFDRVNTDRESTYWKVGVYQLRD